MNISQLNLAIHTLTKSGLTRHEIKYEITASDANELMACHWQSEGIEVINAIDRAEELAELEAKTRPLTKEEKNGIWNNIKDFL